MGPIVTLFDSLFPESIKDREVEFGHNFPSILYFVPLKFGIDILNSLETMRFLASSVILNIFFHCKSRLKWTFLIPMDPLERSSSELLE